MLFKLSLSNIRKSLRDYAIYFFTLIIGVSVFYVFNAIGGQAAMLQINNGSREKVELLTSMLSGVSVFVAGVLGLLIVYASRFLMKRRSKEFALYMILGMGKGRISAIFLMETVIIGIGSLGVGLIVGIGLSQLMSALVANLFEADMTAYRFSVSGEAILKTILYFAVMYLVVMIFNSGAILALKELSESVDSITRYEMLRKIGAEESDISKSLFRQTGIFFLLPLILACVHSVFGMKFAAYFLEIFGTEKMAESITATSIIIVLIYGGYFLITYYCSKGIIKERR